MITRKNVRLDAMDCIAVLVKEYSALVLDPLSNSRTESEIIRIRAEMLWIADEIKQLITKESVPF